jgi:hypothetical protein
MGIRPQNLRGTPRGGALLSNLYLFVFVKDTVGKTIATLG